jgi:penicillin V acylase-like amidase (Ntn superfamily)
MMFLKQFRPKKDIAHSCSTFMVAKGNDLLIGHNLDDYIEAPGLIVINKRGVLKENISWKELSQPSFGRRVYPKISWRSSYGSITYNTGGKEFIDGGLNEAGLYVGEMTLYETQYPSADDLPKIYHHQWMQYLLDNFESVDQVVESLTRIIIDGHCLWHFFVADRQGEAIIIEFLEGKPVIYRGENMPFKVLCNAQYSEELKKLAKYEGFGGTDQIDFHDYTSINRRFPQAAAMFREYESHPVETTLDFAFKILNQIKGDNNKWGILYDVRNLRMYFYTSHAESLRFVDFNAFDFSDQTPTMILDVHKDLSGDANQHFLPFDPHENRKHIFWNAIRVPGFNGWLYQHFVFPRLTQRMTSYAVCFAHQREECK